MVDGFSIHVSFFTSHICAMFISPLPFIYHSLNFSLPLPNQKDMQNHLSMQIRPMALHEEAGLSCGERNERGKKWRNDNYIFFFICCLWTEKTFDLFTASIYLLFPNQTQSKQPNRLDKLKWDSLPLGSVWCICFGCRGGSKQINRLPILFLCHDYNRIFALNSLILFIAGTLSPCIYLLTIFLSICRFIHF